MPTLYIANSFSLSMLDQLWQMTPKARVPRPVRDPDDFVRSWAESDDPSDQVLSIIGDADTAALFSDLLDIPIVYNPTMTVTLLPGDVLLIGQYKNATIEWWSI